MTPILFLLAAAAQPSPMVDLVDCMEQSASTLAAGNDLPVDSVFKAAQAECQVEWRKMERTWEGNRLVDSLNGRRAIEEERDDRERIYLAAFKAVAKVRSR